jgi:DNA repair photolyase
VTIVTKSSLIERDLDLLGLMAAQGLVQAAVSVTTLDRTLARKMEPRATAPQRRLQTIAALAQASIPTAVMFAPVIPALNDSEMENVLQAAKAAGASSAGYVLVRLPRELAELFEDWLNRNTPLKAAHVMSLIRQSRGGKEYDSNFGSRMRGSGQFAELIAQRFRLAVKKLGLERWEKLDVAQFTPPAKATGPQMGLFD